MTTILVTGGAGFIGCNFVRHALDRTPARVVAIDKLTYAGSELNIRDLEPEPRFSFVRADIGDRTAVEAALREFRPSWVVNFAAETHVDRSIDNPRAFVETNVVATFELLEAVRHYFASLDSRAQDTFRFLQVSTDEVYGSAAPLVAFAESSPYAPNSPYAASKAAADHFARAYSETYGLPILITNSSNNYGPFQFPEKLIPLALLNALEGKPLPIYGDGRHVRDWLYVQDHCEALWLVLERGRPGERYNIGAMDGRTNLEVIDRLCAILQELAPPRDNPRLVAQGVREYAELKTFVPDRPGHDRCYAIDATKIRDALRWKPRHDFDWGLRKTVQWYLEHREWCAAVQAAAGYSRERLGLGVTGKAERGG